MVFVLFFADFDSATEKSWIDVEFTLADFTTQLMFEATRGGATVGEDEGDISIDNIEVTDGHCEGKTTIATSQPCQHIISSCTHVLVDTKNNCFLYYLKASSSVTRAIRSTTTRPWHHICLGGVTSRTMTSAISRFSREVQKSTNHTFSVRVVRECAYI